MGEKALHEVLEPCVEVPGLLGAPATIDLAGAEIELVSQVAREYRLSKAITALSERENFDYILLDCPPSLGLLTLNGLVAAKEVLLPIQCEYYALEGLSQLLKTVGDVGKYLNPTLHLSTILLTMYDSRTNLSHQVASDVREHFPAETLDAVIPRSVRSSISSKLISRRIRNAFGCSTVPCMIASRRWSAFSAKLDCAAHNSSPGSNNVRQQKLITVENLILVT